MIEFPNEKEFRRWYESPEYQAIVTHRLKGAKCDTLLVGRGVPPRTELLGYYLVCGSPLIEPLYRFPESSGRIVPVSRERR